MSSEDKRKEIRARAKHNTGILFDLRDSLISARRSLELSQEEVADRMGVSVETVREFEKYDTFWKVSVRILNKYANAVEVSFSAPFVSDSE